MSETNGSSCAYHYTVKRGDSFYLIAHRLGVSLRDLLDANPDIPPARLTVGDVLCIPYDQAVQTPAGDSSSASGSNNSGSNGSSSNDGSSTAGNNPSGGTGGSTAGSAACPETPSVPDTPNAPEGYVCPANRRAIVQEGQSASDLQLRYDLSYYTLQSANAQTDLDQLRPGDIVCIPESNFPCPLASNVTLKENESLESIAVTYNLPIASLLRVNPCLAPEDFTPGTTIRLPE